MNLNQRTSAALTRYRCEVQHALDCLAQEIQTELKASTYLKMTTSDVDVTFKIKLISQGQTELPLWGEEGE